LRSWQSEGEKLLLKCFKDNYIVILTVEKKAERDNRGGEKFNVQIFDTLNIYFAYHESFNKVEFVSIGFDHIFLVTRNTKDERTLLKLTEKENAFKIETFFKKSYFNEAWRFAKNQNSDPSLLAEISRLHGYLLYNKNDFSGAIKQYILTLGHIEPSYVIRRFLDVSQIEFLIEYLENIHAKKIAKREHTALLLNCYVKQQKIENLSNFLSESSVESDLFDIETAIKVCRDLKHTDLALKLAEQKKQHEYYLKILIEDLKDYEKAL
jgi:ATP adenylyltransferase/5',5'''-P-1,P-4-tetraphosphate phosphorylase II